MVNKMYLHVFVFDFDGTLTEGERLSSIADSLVPDARGQDPLFRVTGYLSEGVALNLLGILSSNKEFAIRSEVRRAYIWERIYAERILLLLEAR